MDFVRDSLDPVRKLLRIRDHTVVLVTLAFNRVAVVHYNASRLVKWVCIRLVNEAYG